MTTPERLRRRQRLESVGIAVLAAMLAGSVFWFEARDADQRDCLYDYIANDSETTAIRSGLIADESEATRQVILSVLSADSREEVLAERDLYRIRLERIDRIRAANKFEPFDPESCYD